MEGFLRQNEKVMLTGTSPHIWRGVAFIRVSVHSRRYDSQRAVDDIGLDNPPKEKIGLKTRLQITGVGE